MRLEQLVYFMEVAEGKSINKTAEQHYISQSAVSESLKKLETEVGIPLLKKHRSEMNLTLAGQEFYLTCKEILKTWNTGMEQLAKYKQPNLPLAVEQIRIAVSHGLEMPTVSSLLSKLNAAYPDIKSSVREGDFYECLCNVANLQVDFAIILVYDANMKNAEIKSFLIEKELVVHKMMQTKAGIIVSEKSPLASKKQIGIQEALKQKAAILNANMNLQWMKECLKCYGKINASFITDNPSLCLHFIEKNPDHIGFASMLLAHSLDGYKHAVKLIPIKEEIPIHALYVTSKYKEKENQAYSDLTKQFYAYLYQTNRPFA